MSHTVALGHMLLPNHQRTDLRIPHRLKRIFNRRYLQGEGPQYHAAEDGVPVDTFEHVPLSVDLPGVDLVEKLHHDEHVENDGVVLRWRRMQRSVAAAVNVEKLLT